MGMDILYHTPEKIGDFALSTTDTTTFPGGNPVGLNVTDGGVQKAADEQNLFGIAKTSRSVMAATGPGVVGGTQYGSGTVVTGICIVELYDNSANYTDDGSPVLQVLSTIARGARLCFNTVAAARNWTTINAGAQIPYGLVLVPTTESRLGGIVVYFNFAPRA